MTKQCCQCHLTKSILEFYRRKKGKYGVDSKCKKCSHAQARTWHKLNPDKSKAQRARAKNKSLNRYSFYRHQAYGRWRDKDGIRWILTRTQRRAAQNGIECTITRDDIVIPSTCPILGIPMGFNLPPKSPGRPSIDRIDNNKGYVPGNVAIISMRANMLKSALDRPLIKKIMAYVYSNYYSQRYGGAYPMKVVFDKHDLNEKISDILRMDGLEVVGDIIWAGDPGNPEVQMRIEPIKVEKKPEPEVDLRQEILDLRAELEARTVEPAAPTNKQQRKEKPRPINKGLTPRMQEVEAQIEAEAELVGNPLGSTLKRGERRRAPNEFDSMPD